jgi:hypothetical protein
MGYWIKSEWIKLSSQRKRKGERERERKRERERETLFSPADGVVLMFLSET